MKKHIGIRKLINTKKYEEAITKLEKIKNIDQYWKFLLGVAYIFLFKSEKQIPKEYLFHDSRGKQILEDLIEEGYDNPQLYTFYVDMFLQSDYEKQIKILKRGIQCSWKNENAWKLYRYYFALEKNKNNILDILNNIPSFLRSEYFETLRIVTYFDLWEYKKTIESYNNLIKLYNNPIINYVYYFSCIFSWKEKLSLSFFKKQLEEDVIEKYLKINQLWLALSKVYLSTFDINKEKWIYDIVCINEPIDIFYKFKGGEHICTYFNDLEIILRWKIKEMYKDSQIGEYINYYDHLLHWDHKISLKEIENIVHFIESSWIVEHKLVELFQELLYYSIKYGNEKIAYLLTKCYINNFWGNDQVDFCLDLGDIKTRKYYDEILSILRYHITYSRDKNMVDKIVKWLFSNKDYETITSLYYSTWFKEDFCLFEVAYSLNESDTWDIRHQGLKIYEKLLEKSPHNCAILNNLWCIYSRKANPVFNLEKALDFYKQANEIDPQDKLYKKNLTQTSQKFEAQQQENNENEEWLKNIKNDSGISYILSRLEKFQSFKEVNSFIICPGKQLWQYLWVPSHIWYDTMKWFLEKKYVFKVEDHNLDTLATVYKINPLIEQYLEKHKNILQKDREYIDIANKICSENFEKLWLTEDLREWCCNIFWDEQGLLLYKDLHECAMSRLTRQHKTTLILCWSIIESVLYMMIKKEYPWKFTIWTKTFKMKDLNLSSLLEIVKESGLITESQILHSFGLLKWWRNLIHPAFEEKKKAYEILKISQENADIARNLVIQTLKSLF